jgi:putative acetyltransferase
MKIQLDDLTGGFDTAHRLYAAYGFEFCEPFAGYAPDPYSVFMTRTI